MNDEILQRIKELWMIFCYFYDEVMGWARKEKII